MGYYGGLNKAIEYNDRQQRMDEDREYRNRLFQYNQQQDALRNELAQRRVAVDDLRYQLSQDKLDEQLKKEEANREFEQKKYKDSQARLAEKDAMAKKDIAKESMLTASRDLASGIDKAKVLQSLDMSFPEEFKGTITDASLDKDGNVVFINKKGVSRVFSPANYTRYKPAALSYEERMQLKEKQSQNQMKALEIRNVKDKLDKIDDDIRRAVNSSKLESYIGSDGRVVAKKPELKKIEESEIQSLRDMKKKYENRLEALLPLPENSKYRFGKTTEGRIPSADKADYKRAVRALEANPNDKNAPETIGKLWGKLGVPTVNLPDDMTINEDGKVDLKSKWKKSRRR